MRLICLRLTAKRSNQDHTDAYANNLAQTTLQLLYYVHMGAKQNTAIVCIVSVKFLN